MLPRLAAALLGLVAVGGFFYLGAVGVILSVYGFSGTEDSENDPALAVFGLVVIVLAGVAVSLGAWLLTCAARGRGFRVTAGRATGAIAAGVAAIVLFTFSVFAR